MELLLKRRYKGSKYTIGSLYIDGKWFSDTLEDTDRNLSSNMSEEEIKKIKIKNKTAIPTGTYKVNMNTVSPRFKDRVWAKPYKGIVPRLMKVPGYDGVLIHPGSNAESTSGCVLVGRNTIKGMLTQSQNTFHALMKILLKEKNITLTIK